MSADWPTAAAACFSGIERGRVASASRAMPVTMAPELTSATSRPIGDHRREIRGQRGDALGSRAPARAR